MTTLFGLIASLGEMVWLHIGRRPRFYSIAAVGVLALAVVVGTYLVPASGFSPGTIVEVSDRESVASVANELEAKHLIPSALMFRALARIADASTGVKSGRYLFVAPEGSAFVLARLASGDFRIPTVRVTLPEGLTAREMGLVVAKSIPGFDTTAFNAIAAPNEGYLFPDTYDFAEDATPQEVVDRMRENFDDRTEKLHQEAENADIDFNDVVIMASLIEKEANTPEDRRIVAGILQSRIEASVALQVDATFGYIKGISGYVPTGDDPDIDSLYNTYKHRGLPPGPISNPGLDAIDAALHPTKTDYFYYLTGKDGKMYYAKTFEEHKNNREKYLD